MTALVHVKSQYVPNASTALYGPAPQASIIDHVATFNSDGSGVSLQINIVPDGGSVSDANKFVLTTIPTVSAYACPEITHMHLAPGDSIYAVAGTASKVSIRISGRLVA